MELCLTRFDVLCFKHTTQYNGLPVTHEHLSFKLSRVYRRDETRPPLPEGTNAAHCDPGLTLRSSIMRSSGVMLGVTNNASTAALKAAVVAPLGGRLLDTESPCLTELKPPACPR